MPISFACQHCQKTYNVADDLAGKKVKCKACGQAMDVPVQQAAAAQRKPMSGAAAASAAQKNSPQGVATSPSRQQAQTRSQTSVNVAQAFGLGALDDSDLFAGTAPVNHQQNPLANHVIGDPGFAPVTAEEVAFRRQMELDHLRSVKPKLEDYLHDEDAPIRTGGVKARGSGTQGSHSHLDEHAPTGFKPFIPGIVSAGLFLLIALMTVIGGFIHPVFALIGFISFLIVMLIASTAGQIWGLVICYRYHPDQFILYFLLPFYALIYLIQHFNIMKGPFALMTATFFGSILFVVMLFTGMIHLAS